MKLSKDWQDQSSQQLQAIQQMSRKQNGNLWSWDSASRLKLVGSSGWSLESNRRLLLQRQNAEFSSLPPPSCPLIMLMVPGAWEKQPCLSLQPQIQSRARLNLTRAGRGQAVRVIPRSRNGFALNCPGSFSCQSYTHCSHLLGQQKGSMRHHVRVPWSLNQ